MRARTILCVSLAMATVGCRRREQDVRRDDAIDAATPDAAPSVAPLTFRVGATSTRASSGVVRASRDWARGPTYEFAFFPAPTTCDAQAGEATAKFVLDGVAASAMISGAPVGVRVRTPEGIVEPWQATARIDAATIAPEGHVVGRLSFDVTGKDGVHRAASGAFDLIACGDIPPPNAQLANAPAITGDLGGDPFTPKSAIALVHRDDDGAQDVLAEIHFFAEAGVDCARLPSLVNERHMALLDIAGAGSKQAFTGSPQLARGALVLEQDVFASWELPSWIVFHTFDVAPGKTFTAAAHVVYGDHAKTARGAGRIDGEFTATICAPP